jgi:hydroxypyruvate isomerase
MGRIKQSVAWWCFADKLAPEVLIREAARIGYAGVEMCPEEHFQKVVDSGMKMITHNAHRSIAEGLNRLNNHDRIRKETEHNLALAQKWGIPVIIMLSGNREGLPDDEGIENTVVGLNRLSKAAEQAGVTLALELLNSKVDHPDYQCDHTEWGVKVVKAVDSPRVKLLYDIYHMQIMEGDVIRTIRNNIDHIGHFHTAGNPGRNELDETQELYYPPIMRAIAATNFSGYVGQEFVPLGDPVAGLEAGYKLCDV